MNKMKRAIEQYKQITKKNNFDFSAFDVYQIRDQGGDPVYMITDALKAGYAIGYRQCKKQMKENAPASAATRARA